MKVTIFIILLAVICFGQPAAVWSFAVQPHQMEEELNQAFQQSQEQQMREIKANAAFEARMAVEQKGVVIEVSEEAQDSSSGIKTFMYIVGGLVAAMGVGAKFFI